MGAKTVLIRAVGPTLGQPPLNVGAVMADLKLKLYSGQEAIAANDNWGTQFSGTSATRISAAADSVGGFKIADVRSRNAVLLVTLNP